MPERQIERVRKLALPHIVNRTRLNTRAGMVRVVPRDTNKHDCGHPVVASCTIELAQPSGRSAA